MGHQIRWCKIDNPQGNKNIFQLAPNSLARIGREIGNDILLVDETVSRLHAELYSDAKNVYVVDSGSHNGTQLDGKMVIRSVWHPGQLLTIGPFKFELCQADELPFGQKAPQVSAASVGADSKIDPAHLPRAAGDANVGRIKLSEVYQRAKANDPSAVHELFAGFLSRGEQVVDCGYLGALGFYFPEHSFWCVTHSRVCGMLVNSSGRVDFTFGFLKALNTGFFHQPSVVKLWITIIMWLLFMALCALSLFYYVTTLLGYAVWIGATFGLVIEVLSFWLIPWVERVYYRYSKSGCVFFTRELVPILIFADRKSLKEAQRFISVYADQKRISG